MDMLTLVKSVTNFHKIKSINQVCFGKVYIPMDLFFSFYSLRSLLYWYRNTRNVTENPVLNIITSLVVIWQELGTGFNHKVFIIEWSLFTDMKIWFYERFSYSSSTK